MPSKNDYKLLYTLYQHECINEMKSLTVNRLSEFTTLSVPKVRKTITQFKKMSYIKEGAFSHNAKTYYITDVGINKVNELMGGIVK